MTEPPIDGSLAVLKHVMRRQLLRCLNESEDFRTSESLAGQVQGKLTAVSYHLRTLERARLASIEIRRSKRGVAERFYGSRMKGDPAVEKFLEETAESDEKQLPRKPVTAT